jgi:hypothetical protein
MIKIGPVYLPFIYLLAVPGLGLGLLAMIIVFFEVLMGKPIPDPCPTKRFVISVRRNNPDYQIPAHCR